MNPIQRILEERQLKAKELAIFLEVDVIRIYEYKTGSVARLPEHVLEKIEQLFGEKADVVQKQYQDWRRGLASVNA